MNDASPDPGLRRLSEGVMTSNPNYEPIRRPADAQATRFATNPNWTYRGDNTKYKEKK